MMLVLGLGNRLMGDDAVGPNVVDALAAEDDAPDGVSWRDGGTMGLALLPEIESCDALVVVDAARYGLPPGVVQVFEGDEMDRRLGGRHHSAHELALSDLMGAAALSGGLPSRRALVAVEPADTGLNLSMSPAVSAAVPAMCDAVRALLTRWRTADAPPAPFPLPFESADRPEESVHEPS